jgi:hypothetical protein
MPINRVYCTGTDAPADNKSQTDPPNIVPYDYYNSKAGHCAKSYLQGYSGYLQVDGCAGYEKTDATLVSCLAQSTTTERTRDQTLSIGRENRMFANTANGAIASAILYGLINTAKENGLVPFDCIKYLPGELPIASVTCYTGMLI